MRRLASVLFVAGVLIITGGTATQAAEDVTVQTKDFKFDPASVSVDPGGSITFDNTGAVAHTATADNDSFDTGNIATGSSKSITISAPGTYGYYCKYHGSPGSGMHGTITVGGKGAGPLPQTASPLPLIAVLGVLLLLGSVLLGKRRTRAA